jgi:hypothetical protein
VADRVELGPQRSQGLVDILDRVLDKGLVVAGDIKVNLANVELLTIRIRLLVCSIDKAESIGMNWWRTDPSYGGPSLKPTVGEMTRLTEQIDRLSAKIDSLEQHQNRITRTHVAEK